MRHRSFVAWLPLLALLALTVTFAPSGGEEVQIDVEIAQQAESVAEIKADDDPDDPEESVEAEFPGGAGLKTDPELETYLKRAEQFVAEDRYDLATILWQRVLNESGETVMTRPGNDWVFRSFDRKYRKYKSVSAEIERTIARLPDIGLRQYRLSADGEAHGILAAGKEQGREEALANVVRTYFMSSLGDDAAFELACLRLDRHDFVGAARLLSHVLNDYPDSDIPRGELLVRLAFANARLGDESAAQSNLAALARLPDGTAFGRITPLIENEIAAGENGNAQGELASAWHMPWGGPRRVGAMPSLPAEVTSATLSEAWFENFDLGAEGFQASNSSGSNQIMFDGGFGGGIAMGKAWSSRAYQTKAPNVAVSRDQLLAKWREKNWTPAGQMLISDGLVYYKRHDRVVCREADTGKLRWMSRESNYEPPALSAWLVQMQRSYGMNASNDQPSGPLEAFLFGDRLNQAMIIDGDMLFSIDGPLEGEAVASRSTNTRFNYQNIPRRTRNNVLCAYDVANGKFKWMRPADGGGEGGKFDVGYMAAPVPYAKFLLVPVSDNGSLWLYALNKTDGKLAWKSFLCEDPMSGASPFSPIGLSVDGGDAYVATGGGVVIAVDAMSGAVRWATRYQRSTKGGFNMARFGRPQTQMQGLDGWEQDVVVPHGRALVVIASDSDKLFALDRRTGELLWESPRQPTGDDDAGEYYLGTLDDGMFLAGKKSLRRYDLNKDGRLMWEARFVSPSNGHGVLTSDAIYMPTGESIARVNPANGKIEAQVGVFSPTKEPVGNLYSDGERLLAIGLARAYSLQDLKSRMDSLATRIADGDSEAQLERMRLHLRGNDFDAALADLRGAHALRLKAEGGLEANLALYGGIREMEIVSRDPRLAMRLIAQAQSHLEDQSNISADELKTAVTARDGLIFTSLYNVRKDETAGAAAEVLDVAAIVEKSNLVNAARQALAKTVTPEDAPRLQEALKSDNANARIVALAGAEKAFGDEASKTLEPLLDDDSDEVRLFVAIALANAGDRRALTTMGDLLDADNVQIRSRAVQSLRAVSGQRFKYMAYEKDDARRDATKAWQDWIAADGQTAELKLPIGDSSVLLGRTLVAMYSQNRVVEYDADRKIVWEKKGINQPWGVEGLPNGNRLICSYNGRFVVEFDSEGKEVWRIDNLPGNASHAHRLDNGNTLIVSSSASQVWEYSPEKKVVWQQRFAGNPQDARRLDNGNTLIALQSSNKVIEINPDGKEVWSVPNMNGAFAARRLDNGNTLVALTRSGQVVEVTPDKKTIWNHSGLKSPYDAQRLDNGNTLIVDTRGFREVEPGGKIVWQENVQGTLRIHRY